MVENTVAEKRVAEKARDERGRKHGSEWIQGQLFPLEVSRPRVKGGALEVRGRRLDHSRVTRDEAVALAYERTQQAQHETKLGLARALSRLSPEKRQALRDILSAPRRVA